MDSSTRDMTSSPEACGPDVYLSLDKFSYQTVHYLTTNPQDPTNDKRTFILLDPARTYEVKLKKRDQVVFTHSTLFDITKFLEAHPQALPIHETKNQFGQTIMTVYQQP